ncbi:DUF6917 domain-containing protein [Calderihabitans maritimus]|uniref:DUF6917 domain-containing protein n=1 Tax=Calderihabitans maritimus TaxID=1246530 RepID=A0A1Z5HSH1_9FIRM|nr:hypothetical protein [Calderihabitans maritimus]GAW92281.1 hypothetical protein KKC1_14370 [Calderihabitans maritimus]
MFKENPYALKKEINGRLVVVLRGKLEKRGLELISSISRVVKQGEIHELIVTTQEASPGGTVERVAYIGFVEIYQGGVIVVGDGVYCGEQYLGQIVGFEETHMPNHLNLVIRSDDFSSGLERGLELDMKVIFKQRK